MMKVILLFLCMLGTVAVSGQFAYGLTAKTELYSRYSNPQDGIASPASGSALINLGLGPKIWIGGENFSLSGEAVAVISPFAVSLGDFKGLGAVSLPVMAKINIGGLSTLNKEGKFGFSAGVGYQWTRTELFGLTSKFEDQDVSRKYFKNLIGEVGFGFGMGGFAGILYLRYGRDSSARSNIFTLGLGYDFNAPRLKVTTDSEF